jgi:FKBP-type peptidyl-prolyl cis-trans isomerase (trigger factor)
MAKATTTSEKTEKKAVKTAKTPKTDKSESAAATGKKLIGDNTTFTVTVEWSKVEEAQKKALEKSQSTAKLEGFRKGKAPLALVAQTLGEKGLREITLETVLPDMYRQGLQEHNYLPLTDPEVRLESIEPGQDWKVTFIIATPPEISLEGYEKVVADVKAKHEAFKEKKAEKIEGDKEASPEQIAETQRGERINALIEALLEKFEIIIPELLMRTEAQRRLQDLSKQLEQVNMSLEDYLARSNKTVEQLQQETAAQGLIALQVEMLLGGLVRHKKITIDHDLVHKALPHDRQVSQAEHDYVESMLLKQAAVDHLLSL